ncbi:MAG: hypothetical protein Q9N34_06870 [Aquificota bacterium]|nr:hypothetical protein [Aquificota bacterium]
MNAGTASYAGSPPLPEAAAKRVGLNGDVYLELLGCPVEVKEEEGRTES